MPSRRDQVQAYFFVVGRLVAALTHGKPDVVDPPNRRLSTGTVLGFLLGGLLVAIFGIYGLFVPGNNNSWQQPGSILVVKETGARYLYLNGVLRPVLNYTSARLAVNSAGTAIVSVSQNSLAGTPVGSPIGIPGAPDDLPAANSLDSGPWSVCVQDTNSGSTITLMVDQGPASVNTDQRQGALVSTVDGTKYLLWQGKRYRLADAVTAEALGYGSVPALKVPDSWLNPLPVGRDLTVPSIPDVGQPGPTISGRQSQVGQVYEVRNTEINSDELFLAQANGLDPLSRTAAALILGAPSFQDVDPGGSPIEIGPSALADVSVEPAGDLATGYPPPLTGSALVDAASPQIPCVRYTPSPGKNMTTDLVSMPAAQVTGSAVPTPAHVAGTVVDQVSIPGGSGILASDLPAPGGHSGTEYLITDNGVKYPLSNASVASTLGYGQGPVVDVPSQLLDLLPTGPALDPSAALASQPAGN